MTVPPPRWRKSSRSDQTASCVEVAHTLASVRDSKNPGGPTLAVDALPLLAAVKASRFDR